jgi:hypothetical protein
MSDRSAHYSWSPDDIVVDPPGQDSGQSARARVRQSLGDVAHAMSDAEVDAVIEAARVDTNGEGDLAPEELDEIDALLAEFGESDDE